MIDGQKYFITNEENRKIFRKLNNRTSSGMDQIPNIALKQLPCKAITQYTRIFNNCYNNLHYPDRWTIARVIPIPNKDKDLTDPASFRPLSLLLNVSKVFKCHNNNIINSTCKKNNIIPHNQFGFQGQLSTIHAIAKLLSDLNTELSDNNMVAACLIDLEKAFDSVWIKGLIFKLS